MAAYFGDPGISSNSSPEDELQNMMPIFHAIRNRNLQDYRDKGMIDQDLEIRKQHLQSVFDPITGMPKSTNNEISHGITPPNTSINTVMQQTLTPQEQAQLGLKGRELDLEGAKIKQSGKLGEEKLGLQNERESLNREKASQIHEIKQQDLQRKIDASDSNLKLAYDRLQQNQTNQDAINQYHNAQVAAQNARNEANIAQRDRQLEDIKALHQAEKDKLNEEIENLKHPKQTKTTTEVNPEGTKKTVTSEKNSSFSSSTTKRFKSKDGSKTWNIPMDKIKDFQTANPDAQEVESR